MAQVRTDSEEKVLKEEDQLKDMNDESQQPQLTHVNVPEEGVQMEEDNMGKSDMPEVPVENDPLSNVKQELEHHSPHLKHVESPYSPGHASQAGRDVVKSEVPPAFVEELRNDHDIIKGQEANATAEEEGVNAPSGGNFVTTRDLRDPGLLRGRPRFRISAHVGNRPGINTHPMTANMCFKDEADEEDDASNEATPTLLPRSGVPARETPVKISALQGMRPGGPLSRDLKAENLIGSDTGADLPGETKPKGPGLHRGGAPSGPSRGGLSSSGPRRGGLARTGSGVPGEQKLGGGSLARTGSGVPGEHKLGGGSLARTGSGVPGEQKLGGGSLARTGSGAFGNSLARQGSGAFGSSLGRTGSGIPSVKGGSDLNDFASFLNSDDFPKEEV